MKTINKKQVGYLELTPINLTPANNQMWIYDNDIYVRLNGVTKKLNDQSGGGGGTWGSITGTLSDQTDLQNALNAKANDNAVVKLTGNQTVAGVKTFSSFPVTPSSAPTTNYQTANKKYVDDGLATKANDVDVVKLFGDQDIEGVKRIVDSSDPFNTYLRLEGHRVILSNSTGQMRFFANEIYFNNGSRIQRVQINPSSPASGDEDTQFYLPKKSGTLVVDATSDGKTYGRKDGGWTSAFTISLNFIDETVTTIKAPRAMKINSVTAESGTPTIQVNGSPYTLGNTIAQFDEITVTATVDTLVNLNCE